MAKQKRMKAPRIAMTESRRGSDDGNAHWAAGDRRQREKNRQAAAREVRCFLTSENKSFGNGGVRVRWVRECMHKKTTQTQQKEMKDKMTVIDGSQTIHVQPMNA